MRLSRDTIGLTLGITGMICCLAGLGIGITGILLASDLQLARMIALEIGAVLLLGSVLLKGKDAMLYIVLEATTVLYGILYFLHLDAWILFGCRLVICCVAFGWMWRRGLLATKENKLGAAGLEAIGYGQMTGSSLGFAVGGYLLSCYSAIQVRRRGGWANRLWLCLNVPFAIAAFLEVTVTIAREVSLVFALEAVGAAVLIIGASIFAFVYSRFLWIGAPRQHQSISAALRDFFAACDELPADQRRSASFGFGWDPRDALLDSAVWPSMQLRLIISRFHGLSAAYRKCDTAEQLEMLQRHQAEYLEYSYQKGKRRGEDVRGMTLDEIRAELVRLAEALDDLRAFCEGLTAQSPILNATMRELGSVAREQEVTAA